MSQQKQDAGGRKKMRGHNKQDAEEGGFNAPKEGTNE